MPTITDDSDSDSRPSSSRSSTKLFGRERTLHSILGGGKVADIILWKNKSLSAVIFAAVTVIWFLFEVVEYNFVTLVCHISIVILLATFIWCNGAALLGREPPKIPDIILSESKFKEVALAFHSKQRVFITILFDIAIGKDLKLFLLAIALLWILSTVGSNISSLSLLYFVFLCIQTLPALYDQYEDEVDYLAGRGSRKLKKVYRKFDSKGSGQNTKGTSEGEEVQVNKMLELWR
ncbi:reticulon-like protein B2 [Cinnamomum micranthum f. kanehirae]|uniref:Reticulon-like protein n=1 Tax=Cinnamomum micranthum f. kanehirae TaxID=337451 RepID=A0A443NU85_9MAGN|nr:reticulon-like protein B2 [Cinnamomum micranthum f. kanehirae]